MRTPQHITNEIMEKVYGPEWRANPQAVETERAALDAINAISWLASNRPAVYLAIMRLIPAERG